MGMWSPRSFCALDGMCWTVLARARSCIASGYSSSHPSFGHPPVLQIRAILLVLGHAEARTAPSFSCHLMPPYDASYSIRCESVTLQIEAKGLGYVDRALYAVRLHGWGGRGPLNGLARRHRASAGGMCYESVQSYRWRLIGADSAASAIASYV